MSELHEQLMIMFRRRLLRERRQCFGQTIIEGIRIITYCRQRYAQDARNSTAPAEAVGPVASFQGVEKFGRFGSYIHEHADGSGPRRKQLPELAARYNAWWKGIRM